MKQGIFLLYQLRANKILLWKNETGNLSFSFNKQIGIDNKLKEQIKIYKAELLDILEHNSVHTEQQAKSVIFYKIPEYQRDFNLSPIQKGMYLQHKLDIEKYTYNIPILFRLTEKNIDKLKTVLSALFDKHIILKTKAQPDFQYSLLEKISIEVSEVNEEDIPSVCEDRYKREFSIDNGKLCIPEIIKIKDTDDVIINITHHHMLSDALSASLLIKDFLKIYCNAEEDLESTINYYDYVAYQYYELQTPQYQDAIKRLTDKLDKAQILQLKKISYIASDNKANYFSFIVDPDTTKNLTQLSVNNDISLYSILLTCLYHVFSVYSEGQTQFPIGLTVSNRPDQLNKLVGPFINTLPMIPDYNDSASFIDNARNINEEIILLNHSKHKQYDRNYIYLIN